MLIELIPSIGGSIGSEVIQVFNCTISTYVISGFKMLSFEALHGENIGH
ncbi:MAG: hypothetical protein IIA51_04790 [Chloroflexi bacterium]|nr:hypothetical protein [Chloroflexota bacterium]MCH8340855.1 hypothetical protein [Chloroflexota bacterium]